MRSASVPVNVKKENSPQNTKKQLSKGGSPKSVRPNKKLSELYEIIDSEIFSVVEEKPKTRIQLMFIGAPNESKIAKDFSDAEINDFVCKDKAEDDIDDNLIYTEYSYVESDLDLFKDRVQW